MLSGLESDYFLILDYNSEVVDIREQYPLLLDETVKLAQTMNIRHPRKPGELFPTVMTTDFLITLKNGKSIARSVKPSSDLENERVCKKLMLEREYWSRRGVDWKIVTEKEINRDMTMNLRWLYYGSEELPTEEYKRYETAFLECYQDKNLSFTTILEIIEEAFNLPHGTGMKIFRWMVLNEKITLDLQHPICLTEPRSFAQHSRRVY